MHIRAGPANRKGFTLIELLIVLVILSILAGVVMLSIGGALGTAKKTAYTSIKQQVQNAAVSYAAEHLGAYPLTGNTTVIDGKTLGIIDICAMLVKNSPGGLFAEIPRGFISLPTSDNCDSQIYDCSCNVKAHYIWAIDLDGNLYSSCVDTVLNEGGCQNTSSDGFQGAWP